MKVYLDNCCYNRPYDDQTQTRIFLETQAKLQIQRMVRNHKLELVSSYVLMYENSKNPHEMRRNAIKSFVKEHTSVYIGVDCGDAAKALADEIISTGVKTADAYHVACAILAGSDCFLTTDNRLLKYRTDKIMMMNPTGFIRQWEEL